MYFFKKKTQKNLAVKKISPTFAHANGKVGSVAQLNRASDYGSEGCGFESRRNHNFGLGELLKTALHFL